MSHKPPWYESQSVMQALLFIFGSMVYLILIYLLLVEAL